MRSSCATGRTRGICSNRRARRCATRWPSPRFPVARAASPARAFPRCAPVTRREAADRRQGMLLLAPTALALGALTVYPGAWVLWLSLQHRIPIFGVARFAGLDNFTFLSVDARFWSAAHTTAVFTVASVALEVVLGGGAALAIHTQRRGRAVALSFL